MTSGCFCLCLKMTSWFKCCCFTLGRVLTLGANWIRIQSFKEHLNNKMKMSHHADEILKGISVKLFYFSSFYLFECDNSRHWTILDTSEWWLEVTDTMPEPMTSLWLSQTHQHHDQPRDIDQNESRKLWCDDKAASRYCNVFGFWMILKNCSEDLCHIGVWLWTQIWLRHLPRFHG